MRRTLALTALLALIAASAWASEDPESRLYFPREARPSVAARRPRPSVRQFTPDSVYLGHSYTNHWSATDNYWNLYTGSYLPGSTNPNNAFWDWDHATGFGPGTPANLTDSLEGWWPVRRPYSITGSLTLSDASRPWWALDYGNSVNYRLNASAANRRTPGVIGVWHHDDGVTSGKGVTWTPISGTKSAWCGLRQHGDRSFVDAITKNAYNAQAAEFTSSVSAMPAPPGTTGTLRNFPGYMDAWDQMLYRDISITVGTPVTLGFQYRTRMSTQRDAASATATGLFYGDPLATTTGNFISATAAGANAPIDSFMVYVGVPTNATVVYSDGVARTMADPQRRWFDEVIKVFGAGNTYYELFAATGSTDTLAAAPAANVTITANQVNALLAAQGGGASGTARLVFRVKTNKDYADDDTGLLGYSSRGWGAAQIDNVTANGTTIGSFEGSETAGVPGTPDADAPIDNSLVTSALQNWKSTGRPPAVYWHPRALSALRWEEICGPPGSPNVYCNMAGTVISSGNRDDNEGAGERRFFPDRERQDGMLSPTINLVTDPSGLGETPNNMGINWVCTQAWNLADDYYIAYDVYTGIFNLNFTGNAWTFGAQSYPTRQPNGGQCWGEIRQSGTQLWNAEPRCFTDYEGLYQNLLVRTSNADNVPDSLRIFLGKNQQCFRFGVSTACGANDGGYFDNVALLFSNTFGGDPFHSLVADVWQWWQDTFTANETIGLPGTAPFDTTSAWIKTGLNIAPGAASANRYDVPGDTTIVKGWGFTPPQRVDLVFRILPGPGNYQIASGRTLPVSPSMQLLRSATDQSQVVTPGDASFWGQYLADNGTFGSPGGHYGHTRWDPITWNSARCDTAERNVFPSAGFGANVGGASGLNNEWASMYHESDPKFATLGLVKFRCFRMDTAITAAQFNIKCDGTVPAWLTTVPRSRTGWDGQTTTREYSKIIPDGLLTPGSHVQYFYRWSSISSPNAGVLLPDTAMITPQAAENSVDGHRWQNLSILPDRWKDPSFGGQGMACMLVVDQADRWGDERAFISIADSIGLTAMSKFGAHNGWHATGTDNLWNPGPNSPAFVHGRNGQPGTVFDFYNVKGSEAPQTRSGGIGSRLALRTPGTLLDGKWARLGPTKEMLRTYYRMVHLMTGPLTAGLGPQYENSQDDVGMLRDFLQTTGGTFQPRGLWANGANFVQAEGAVGSIYLSHATFLTDVLGVELVSPSLTSYSGYTGAQVDLLPVGGWTYVPFNAWGLNLNCAGTSDDVLQPSSTRPEATVAVVYGVDSPFGLPGASVYKPPAVPQQWVSFVDGFRLQDVVASGGGDTRGRLWYAYIVMSHAFAGLNCSPGPPLIDVPSNDVKRYLDAVALFGNPVRSGAARIELTLARAGRAQVKLYDVTGRCVRELADRTFEAGPHELRWDGTDNAGHRLPRGVYFAQVRYPDRGFSDAKKLVLVK